MCSCVCVFRHPKKESGHPPAAPQFMVIITGYMWRKVFHYTESVCACMRLHPGVFCTFSNDMTLPINKSAVLRPWINPKLCSRLVSQRSHSTQEHEFVLMGPAPSVTLNLFNLVKAEGFLFENRWLITTIGTLPSAIFPCTLPSINPGIPVWLIQLSLLQGHIVEVFHGAGISQMHLAILPHCHSKGK